MAEEKQVKQEELGKELPEKTLEDAALETAAGGAPLRIPKGAPRGTMDDRSWSARVPKKTPEASSIPDWVDTVVPGLKQAEADSAWGKQQA